LIFAVVEAADSAGARAALIAGEGVGAAFTVVGAGGPGDPLLEGDKLGAVAGEHGAALVHLRVLVGGF
jgi:hypothetical protein